MDLSFPRFSSEKLPLWFAQVESVYDVYGIISDSEKYNYVVAHIPTDHISLVEDIVLNPPPESRYDHFKYEFIKRMSIHWLKKEKMGDEKPSEFLRRLKKIADHRVPEATILNTWLNQMPSPVRDILSLETSGRVEVIGPMADKVMALLPNSSNHRHSTITTLPSDQFQTILHYIDNLSQQVEEVRIMITDREANDEDEPTVSIRRIVV